MKAVQPMTEAGGQGRAKCGWENFGCCTEGSDVLEEAIAMGELAGVGAGEYMVLGFDCPAGGSRTKVRVGGAVVKALLKSWEPTMHEFDEPGVIFLAVVLSAEERARQWMEWYCSRVQLCLEQ